MGWLLVALSLGLTAQTDLDTRLAAAARLEQAGDVTAARDAYRALLPLTPSDDPRRPSLLDALALVETRSADYADAITHANEAARIYASRGDARRRGVALNTAGLASLYAGDYRTAARTLERAIEQSTAAGDAPGRSEQVTNLGNVYLYLGRYADADEAYESVLTLCDAHRDTWWAPRRRRLVLGNRAVLYQRLGRDEQALAIYKELEASSVELRAREQGQVRANVGVLYRRLGDPVKALQVYDEARSLFARDHHVDGELGILKNRGIVLALDLGQLDAATEVFTEALARAEAVGNQREILQARLYRAEAQLRAGHAGPARQDFDASASLARALGTAEEEWKAWYGLGRLELNDGNRAAAAAHLERALALVESIREAIRVPTLRSDFFSDKREVYDAMIAAVIDGAPADRLFDLIERSHSRAWRERLGLSGVVQLAAVQRALDPGVVLLDFWDSPHGSAVVMVTRDRADVARLRPDHSAVGRLLETLSAGPSAVTATRAADVASGLPIEIPHGTRHAIVVPDGALALVPFELLPIGGRPLVQQVAVSYAPTAALLLRPPASRRSLRLPWHVQLRAFADPVFTSATMDHAGEVRARLTASDQEVRAIASEIAGAASIHTGADNRKAYLYDPRPLPPILHLATHAVADTDAMERSRILFSPAREGSGADYLFLKEAYELDLSGVELAVLSACETERGRLLRGEGVQSFSRAFLAAGARSTVTTLWRVPDGPTATFMRIFYHHLQRGEPRADALRRAKLRFVASGAPLNDPHYWAAFVLTGDGVHAVARAASWPTVILPAAALLLLVVGGIFVRRRNQR